jgi:DNA-directed RNA polymerase specialized sigma24 family protein
MNSESPGDRLERYRAYLRLLPQLNLAPALRPKVDASDIVQQTMVQAHQAIAQFSGTSEAEWRAWLRPLSKGAAARRRWVRRETTPIFVRCPRAVVPGGDGAHRR